MNNPHNADWHSGLLRRFRWTRLRFEHGRWCFQVDRMNNITKRWWEWEKP